MVPNTESKYFTVILHPTAEWYRQAATQAKREGNLAIGLGVVIATDGSTYKSFGYEGDRICGVGDLSDNYLHEPSSKPPEERVGVFTWLGNLITVCVCKVLCLLGEHERGEYGEAPQCYWCGKQFNLDSTPTKP